MENQDKSEGLINFGLEDMEEKRVYETGFLLNPFLADEGANNFVSLMKEFVLKDGTEFVSEEAPKLIQLSYIISIHTEGKTNKYDSAYFGWLKFETKPSEIEKIEHFLKSKGEIIRFIIVKTVRENTIVGKKINAFEANSKRNIARVEMREGEKISDIELDKTIDKLVIS